MSRSKNSRRGSRRGRTFAYDYDGKGKRGNGAACGYGPNAFTKARTAKIERQNDHQVERAAIEELERAAQEAE